MAEIVLGVGTSHSPLLVLGGEEWEFRSHDDRRNKSLNTLDGRLVSYEELLAERGEHFSEQSNPSHFPALAAQAEAALDHLAETLHAINPDVVLVVGDDQGELFGHDNMPAISIFRGEELQMKPADSIAGIPEWAHKQFWEGYRMDLPHRHPGAPQLANDLIKGLIHRGVDIASCDRVVDPTKRGFGHAFGFIIQRLMKKREWPILPVLLNTYFPPNTPTAARCRDIGIKLAEALAESSSNARVAVIASGGLSHFLCEEALDRKILDALKTHDLDTLAKIPQEAMLSGSSEIRNWIMVAAMTGHLDVDFSEYIPVYRTPVGTGIGLGFVTWT
jgi:hypothetical protein